ncbi:iron-containing alcohol dehydrogenase [Neobacillus sp. PS3-40]|uniref:iron-containing alcohol dehydrogenase n=1 Tax=Neobacillus sp. PS3-40 TaxID=3070679 RepID=UPI0027E05F8E|nr:iron-containing alcohol dehydrogenase [Neobacillus sp. PS3-40]WML46022.1 iron-containing alcohol dehydrogenase [Neobacillus sp. PS3-40]
MEPQVYGFFMPSVNLLGIGAAKQVGQKAKELGATKVLVITGKTVEKLGFAQEIADDIRKEDIPVVFFSDVEPNPTDKNVEAGVNTLKTEKCDMVVAIGGGSTLDCAKAIALVGNNGGSIADYAGIDVSKSPMVPLITVNTTAGTASEMTRIAVITNTETSQKMVIVDKHITPTISINDPQLTTKLPAELTAGTGMDALTHAVEAYVSILATPVTDACALQAIRLVGQNLRNAVENGQDLVAREGMTNAQFLAGMAFNNALLGYAHAIAHQLGGIYNLPHGLCNAILLPHIVKFNLDAKPERFADIAIALGADVSGLSPVEAAEKAVDVIAKLGQDVGIPNGLSEIGVKEEDIPMLAELSMKDPCALFNPKKATLEDVISILKSAF